MSNKVIKNQVKPQKPANPGLKGPILTQVSKEQKDYLEGYGSLLFSVLQKVWSKFGKGPFDLNQAAALEDKIVQECDNYLTTKFGGVLNLQDYVVVLGSLAGLKSGFSAIKGKAMTSEHFHGAGQLFEASMRIMSESTRNQFSSVKKPVDLKRVH